MRPNSKHATETRGFANRLQRASLVFAVAFLPLCCPSRILLAQSAAGQTAATETTEQKIEHLTAAVAQAQAQLEANQKQLLELRKQLEELQQQMAAEKTVAPPATQPATANTGVGDASAVNAASLGEIRERQAVEESQISTHDVIKVETQSKYPLTVSGLLLFNAFVNTRQVDIAASPAYAVPGSGSTG